MPRLAGIDLPDSKRIDYSLTLIFGIGWKLSAKILETAKVPAETRIKDLTEDQTAKLAKTLEDYTIEGDLRKVERQNVQRLKDINSYKGSRHSRGLPVHGQRTKTNARTKKGKRKTVGAFKKEVLAKMTTPAKAGAK